MTSLGCAQNVRKFDAVGSCSWRRQLTEGDRKAAGPIEEGGAADRIDHRHIENVRACGRPVMTSFGIVESATDAWITARHRGGWSGGWRSPSAEGRRRRSRWVRDAAAAESSRSAQRSTAADKDQAG